MYEQNGPQVSVYVNRSDSVRQTLNLNNQDDGPAMYKSFSVIQNEVSWIRLTLAWPSTTTAKAIIPYRIEVIYDPE